MELAYPTLALSVSFYLIGLFLISVEYLTIQKLSQKLFNLIHFRTSSKGCTPEGHSSRQGCLELQLPQEVLESLFNMPTPKSAEREPSSMNWRNIVKKMTSLGDRSEICSRDGAAVKYSPGIFSILCVLHTFMRRDWHVNLCFCTLSHNFLDVLNLNLFFFWGFCLVRLGDLFIGIPCGMDH